MPSAQASSSWIANIGAEGDLPPLLSLLSDIGDEDSLSYRLVD